MTKDFLSQCIPADALALDAMKVIEKSLSKIALVVNPSNQLIGTITDGDIRRFLLNGNSTDMSVSDFMNTHYRYINHHEDIDRAFQIMRKEVISQIPVLDASRRIVDLIHISDLSRQTTIQNTVIIMAGGKGTRLGPLTEKCPKPMLKVGDKPMLEILIQQYRDLGFAKLIISVNYLKHMIKDYFGDGSSFGVNIQYLEESQPLGTAGALSLLPEPPQHPFLVINGDVLTRVDARQLLHFHLKENADATLCVREHYIQVPYGVVEADGTKFLGIVEKPKHRYLANAGLYILNPSILQYLKRGTYSDMTSLLQVAHMAQKNITVCPIHEYWIDVGLPETFRQATAEWLTGQ